MGGRGESGLQAFRQLRTHSPRMRPYIRREPLVASSAIRAIGTHLAAVTEMLSPAEYDLRGFLEVVHQERFRQVVAQLSHYRDLAPLAFRRQML